MRTLGLTLSAAAFVVATANPPSPVRAFAEQGTAADALHRPLDQILDVNVRDGLVYYRALRASRAPRAGEPHAAGRIQIGRRARSWPRPHPNGQYSGLQAARRGAHTAGKEMSDTTSLSGNHPRL